MSVINSDNADELLELLTLAAKLGLAYYNKKRPPGSPPQPTREQLQAMLAEVEAQIVPWDAPVDRNG